MSRIGPISTVTIAAPELQRMIDSYSLYLGHELIDTGKLSPGLARIWGRPGLAGRRFALMSPAGGGRSFLRFVESRPASGYRPFRHFGWNAAELIVQDPDALAARLADSPFRIIGPPAPLSFSDRIRAMQVLGPSDEALYLTGIDGKLAGLDTPEARSPVDRVFIVILGGSSIESAGGFYAQLFDVAQPAPVDAIVSVLSAAWEQPRDTRHQIVALPLAGQSFIEIDRMPQTTSARLVDGDELPAAIAMVSVEIDSLEVRGLDPLAPAASLPEAPYYGRQAAVCVGASGELLELIEA